VTEELEYRPRWAPHVRGTFPPREVDPETRQPEPVLVRMRCEWPDCRGYHQIVCTSGLMREHVARFALGHVHRDVFREKPKEP
jgi:hypothetical protein